MAHHNSKSMACIYPFFRKDLQDTPIPCGKCSECKKRHIQSWAFRLIQEEKVSMSAQFITLTYATSTIPITANGYLSLSKRDVQLFFKRLRKTNNSKITYYAVGEYGSKTKRPHYHIILFNADLNTIQRAWDSGQVHYGTVGPSSIAYTLKYISKTRDVPAFFEDDRQKEFSLMSKGIGKSYLTAAMKRWHKTELKTYHLIEDGKKVAMPRYYKEKIFDEKERKIVAIEIQGNINKKLAKITDANNVTEINKRKHQQQLALQKRAKLNSTKNEKL